MEEQTRAALEARLAVVRRRMREDPRIECALQKHLRLVELFLFHGSPADAERVERVVYVMEQGLAAFDGQ
jgi:hypothetical protein